MDQEVVLEITGLYKNFGAVKVLKDINLTLKKGQVLGLVGENGAGKSTIMNVLGGIYPKTAGTVELFGAPYNPHTPRDAVHAGIAFIHQELNLFKNLNITENLFIDEGMNGQKILKPKAMNRKATQILNTLGINIDPSTPMEKLTMGMCQMVEIAKAVSKNARIIFFDEPTTSLSASEKSALFTLIRELSARGISMIYISHALEDVFNLCDEIAVIRDGEMIGEQTPAAVTTQAEIINRMVGRTMGQIYPYVVKNPGNEVLGLDGICRSGVLRDVSLSVRAGEIVGMYGLMGAGRTELMRAVYGIDPIDGGTIRYKGDKVTRPSARKWVEKGVAFITENRRDEGLLLPKTVCDNIVLVNMENMGKALGRFDKKKCADITCSITERLHIKTSNANSQMACNLSGGNQQKVVIGKWLLINPGLFIMDEPTRGVDVGAKFEIYSRINQLALDGSGILFISSEMEELMGICDRILVMNRGCIRGELQRDDFSQNKLLELAIGDGTNGKN